MRQEERQSLLRRVEAGGEGWQVLSEVDSVNRRVKVKSYRFENRLGLAALGEHLLSLAREEGCGKVLAEVPEADWEQFLGRGFVLEGLISGYFNGSDAYYVSYFVDPERQSSRQLDKDNAIRERVLSEPPVLARKFDPRFRLTDCGVEVAEELAELYRKVFTTYPTPLHDAGYVRHLIESEEAVFLGVRDGDHLVSAAAAEVNWELRNAEMTDCATLPDYRGEGLMAAILIDLERVMLRRNVPCLFSLARAASPGMNMVLRRLGYRLRGRMTNNCHIMGDFADMNLWVKHHAH